MTEARPDPLDAPAPGADALVEAYRLLGYRRGRWNPLGFEYGYSVAASGGLVAWEAQYGDFVNNAQVVLDQYLATGEVKWGYSSSLVVLLPHGHEGVGPEHSCAHLGRFLQLCAEGNLCLAVPSTSAQLFHLLRRQTLARPRRPLVVMTPKTGLHDEAGSHAPGRALAEGAFQPVIADRSVVPGQVVRAILSSGKVHYDLARARGRAGAGEVALVRVEQLYPFPREALARTLAELPALEELWWVQEEAKNHGAWFPLREELEAACPRSVRLRYAGRPAAAASAVCHRAQHQAGQEALADAAVGRAAD